MATVVYVIQYIVLPLLAGIITYEVKKANKVLSSYIATVLAGLFMIFMFRAVQFVYYPIISVVVLALYQMIRKQRVK